MYVHVVVMYTCMYVHVYVVVMYTYMYMHVVGMYTYMYVYVVVMYTYMYVYVVVMLSLVTFSTVFNNNGYIFIGAKQNHTCQVPRSNWTDSNTSATIFYVPGICNRHHHICIRYM